VLWLVLFLVLLIFKSNRRPQAWLILIPLLAVNLLWSVFERIIPWPSEMLMVLEQVLVSLSVALAVLWLLGDKIGNRNRFLTFLAALFIMTVIGLVGIFSYSGVSFGWLTLYSAIFLALTIAVTLLAFVLSSLCCRKRFGPVRFMLWLAAWSLVISLFVISLLMLIPILLSGGQITPWYWIIYVLVTSLIFSAGVYLVLLPYMVVALRVPIFRDRLYSCLRLRSMHLSSEPAKTVKAADAERRP
jgi:hypothetical protein